MDYLELKTKKDAVREFWREYRLQEHIELMRNDLSREQDLKNACPDCHMIRSAWEIVKQACDTCGYSKKEVI